MQPVNNLHNSLCGSWKKTKLHGTKQSVDLRIWFTHTVKSLSFPLPIGQRGQHWKTNYMRFAVMLFILQVHLYCLLLHAQHCCHFPKGKVTLKKLSGRRNKIREENKEKLVQDVHVISGTAARNLGQMVKLTLGLDCYCTRLWS